MSDNWDDYRLFLAVSKAGSLSKAAVLSGLSPATLSRRMTSLEKSLGIRLFERESEGYSPTVRGEELESLAQHFLEAAEAVERWQQQLTGDACIRLAAGDWTSLFLVEHSTELLTAAEPARLEIVTSVDFANLQRRVCNIAIRSQRPRQPGLVSRVVGRVDFAAYAVESLIERYPAVRSEERFGLRLWLALNPSVTPSSKWLAARTQGKVRMSCSSPRNLLDAVEAGAGLCLLPTFVGDTRNTLQRVSEPIVELTHDRYLVSHEEDRHQQEQRRLLDCLALLLTGR